LNIDDVTTNEYKSYLKSNEILIWSWTTFSKLKDIAKVWWKWYSMIWNSLSFIDLSKEWWRKYDPSCDIEDITIGTQTWAWCNSTLWTWIEYNANNHCYNYAWTDNWWTSCYWFSSKENAYDSTNWVNNIWWKLYTWDNANANACTTWYHLPTDAEWTTLEDTLNGSSCRNWDGWQCDWLGWKNHTTKTSSNNVIEALKLPLAGNRRTDGSTFYTRGYNTLLWSSSLGGSGARGRDLSRYNSTVNRNSRSKAYWFSVRCIKD
jgi:uncharacterized protein (TIGR02145 family)